jgi:hypothetical protein
MCEKHLNGDLPLYNGATCGTKVCKFVNCHHHPAHGQYNAQTNVLRATGQIFKMGGNKEAPALAGSAGQKLIANK